MQGTNGAAKVALAMTRGDKLTRGNARTDGNSYFLFDNHIFCQGFPSKEIEVRHRLLGHKPGLVYFTFAGWVTQSTLRHLRECHPMCRGALEIKRGRAYADVEGTRVELDSKRWYCYDDLRELVKKELNKGATA